MNTPNTPAQTAAQLGGAYDPSPSTTDRFRGYVTVAVVRDGETTTERQPPVSLDGPGAAWAYARAHGGHAEEVLVVDDADATVLHVGRGPDGRKRLLWPTVEMGLPAGYVAAFDQAVRTGPPSRSASDG